MQISISKTDLEGLVKVFSEFGLPKDIKAKLGDRAEEAIEMFAERYPLEAYKARDQIDDKELARKLADKAGWGLLEIDPYKSYQAGEYARDTELMCEAGRRLLEKDPSKAYEAGRKTSNEELLKRARARFAEQSPSEAYNQGRISGDRELIDLALGRIANQTGVGVELVKGIYQLPH